MITPEQTGKMVLAPEQIKALSAKWERVELADPESPATLRVRELLHSMPTEMVLQLMNAEIRFLSSFACTELFDRKLITVAERKRHMTHQLRRKYKAS